MNILLVLVNTVHSYSEKPGGYFGYTERYGNYPGGQAELLHVPFGNFMPLLINKVLAGEFDPTEIRTHKLAHNNKTNFSHK